MGNFSEVFSGLVEDYAVGRKEYPLELIERVRYHLSLGAKSLVLDLGCGVGKSTRQLAERVKFVVGVDPDANSIQRALELGGCDVAYCKASAESLPFADEMFDGITTFCAFHWYYDLPGALDEIYRVLKRRQYFVIAGHDDLGTFHQEVKSVVKRFSDKSMPHSKGSYDPAAVLRGDRRRWRVWTEEQKHTENFFGLGELLPQIRSMAPWSVIPEDRREEASAAMEAHFAPQMKDGVFSRPLSIYLVVARKR